MARAVLLGVGVPVDLVVDAHRRAVGRQPRDAELDVLVAGDARLHEREVIRVARDEREGVHLLVAHRVADVDPRQLQRRAILGVDRHRLAQRADAHRDLEGRRLADAQLDAGLLVLLESLELGRQLVGAERQQRHAEDPGLVRHRGALEAGLDVHDRDGHARQDSAGLVLDGALDRSVGRLRLGRRRSRQRERQQGCKYCSAHCFRSSKWGPMARLLPGPEPRRSCHILAPDHRPGRSAVPRTGGCRLPCASWPFVFLPVRRVCHTTTPAAAADSPGLPEPGHGGSAPPAPGRLAGARGGCPGSPRTGRGSRA